MTKGKIKRTKTNRPETSELEGVYILKIVMFLIVGAQWIRLTDTALTKQVPIPAGLIIGLLFAMHDHFQIDRKIEFAILLVASFVGFWSNTGLFITLLN